MAEYGIYWKNFARESKQGEWPALRWMTNSERLGRCARGDRLWLFTSGVNCGMSDPKAGYLVELFTVDGVRSNQGGDSDYPPGDFRFMLLGHEPDCLALNPPLLVDDILRSPKQDINVSIGTFLQSPRKLRDEVLTRLVERLRSERADLWGGLGDLDWLSGPGLPASRPAPGHTALALPDERRNVGTRQGEAQRVVAILPAAESGRIVPCPFSPYNMAGSSFARPE